jgi:hypothetical protein
MEKCGGMNQERKEKLSKIFAEEKVRGREFKIARR